MIYETGNEFNLESLDTIKENNYRVGIINFYAYFEEFFEKELNIVSYKNSKEATMGF